MSDSPLAEKLREIVAQVYEDVHFEDCDCTCGPDLSQCFYHLPMYRQRDFIVERIVTRLAEALELRVK